MQKRLRNCRSMFENGTTVSKDNDVGENDYEELNDAKSDFGVSMYERVKSRHKNCTRFVSEDDDDLVPAPKRARKILKQRFLRELNPENRHNIDDDSAVENNEAEEAEENNEDEELQNDDTNKEDANEEEEEVEVYFNKNLF